LTDANFEIRAEWPVAPKVGVRDVAHLSMVVSDNVLTQLAEVEAGTVRNYLRASAVTLALWLADNWWRLRWESLHDNRRPSAGWRLRHELTSVSGGTIWPPIMIYGTGERIVIAPSFGANVSSGPVRFLDVGTVNAVPGNVYEAGLDAFFDVVLQACAPAQDAPALAALVGQLREERADAEVAAWRSLEARLGYDPDEAPDDLIEGLSAMEGRLGESAVEEAAIAAPGAQARKVLGDAVDASEASGILADLAIADAVDPVLFERRASPWQWGEDAAWAVRQLIDVRHGPISDNTLGTALGVAWDELKSAPSTARRLPYGARLRKGKSTQKLALQTKAGVDRRFELARIVADTIWPAREMFGVISRAKTERQKFQRAFAQSLLCPFADIRQQIDLTGPTEEQIVNAARDFRVRPSVVQTLLVNKGVLPRETLAERLEAA
jgi:hypothetical protein